MTLTPLVVHVGYPKTATTTFQVRVFPLHSDIDYLGKFIPSYRYRDERTYEQLDALLHRSELSPPDLESLKSYIHNARLHSNRKTVLISSESFIHPSAIDITRVAARLKAVVGGCKILITIREQIGAILSFYWMHGRYGEYLTIGTRNVSESLVFPLSFSKWFSLQMSALEKNYVATLRYEEVISCYDNIFGRENVSVLMFESLVAAPNSYAYDLGQALGVDSEAMMNLMDGGHEHLSEGRTTPWMQADIGRSKTRKLGFFDFLLGSKRSSTFSLEDEAAIASLRDYYRAGNRNLARERGLPLEKYEYAV